MPRASKTLGEVQGEKPEHTRGFHVRTILRVFRRRNLGWAHFGLFLKWLFTDPGSSLKLEVLTHCRHFTGTLAVLHRDAGAAGDLLRTAYIRSCFASGAYEFSRGNGEGKATYVLVRKIRELARDWIKQEYHVDGPLEWDEEGELESAAGALNVQLLPVSEDTQDVDMEDVASTLHNPVGNQVTSGMGLGWASSPNAQSSPQPRPKKSTTKIRVHVLAYLAQWADDEERLSVETSKIVDSVDSVLHLCGCGLCDREGRRSCCEPSHLILGQAALNRKHSHWHECLEVAVNRDPKLYKSLRNAIVDTYKEEYGSGAYVFWNAFWKKTLAVIVFSLYRLGFSGFEFLIFRVVDSSAFL
jgi:hypothetical protein